MKRKNKVLTIIIISIVFIPFLVWLIILHVQTERNFKRYNDVELYTQQKYLDKDAFGEKVSHMGVNASYFLPKYEQIEYNYSDIDFYIFDGTCTLTRTAVTFALDLKFEDKEEYEAAKQNELSTRTFRMEYSEKRWYENPVFEFNLGNYSCKTVDSNGYPRYFELICFNDSSYVLRYLLFKEWESPEYVKDAKYIQKCTNCPWDN